MERTIEVTTSNLYLSAKTPAEAFKKVEGLLDLGVGAVTVTFRTKPNPDCGY